MGKFVEMESGLEVSGGPGTEWGLEVSGGPRTEWGVSAQRVELPFGMVKILEIDGGDGCTTL